MSKFIIPTPSDIVEKAAEIVDDAWCQGRLVEKQGDKMAHCTIGALRRERSTVINNLIGRQGGFEGNLYTSDELEAYRETVDVAAEAIAMVEHAIHLDPSEFSNIADWNDAPERTKEEVIDTLTAVAKDLRNQGK